MAVRDVGTRRQGILATSSGEGRVFQFPIEIRRADLMPGFNFVKTSRPVVGRSGHRWCRQRRDI